MSENTLADWQRGLVDWLELDLDRSLTAEDYQCIDWDHHERVMRVARLPLLLELGNKKISQVRSQSGAKRA